MTTTATELSEAFGLGSVLARIETGQQGLVKTVDKIDKNVDTMGTQLGEMKVTLATHTEQITTLFKITDSLKEDPVVSPVSRREFDDLQAEVRSGRLSWTKIGLLLAGIAAFFAVTAVIDLWTPGT